MPNREPTSTERLEEARVIVWEALGRLEDAQRVLFHAGDHYVGQVWGDGVRAVLEIAERITELSGNLTAIHIEIGRLAKRDGGRGPHRSS
jgi:hypothetical protein